MIPICHKSSRALYGVYWQKLESLILQTSFRALDWLIHKAGIHKRMSVYFNKLLDVFDSLINQRFQLRASSTDNDVLDALLNLNKQHDHELSCNAIKHLLVISIVSNFCWVNGKFNTNISMEKHEIHSQKIIFD